MNLVIHSSQCFSPSDHNPLSDGLRLVWRSLDQPQLQAIHGRFTTLCHLSQPFTPAVLFYWSLQADQFLRTFILFLLFDLFCFTFDLFSFFALFYISLFYFILFYYVVSFIIDLIPIATLTLVCCIANYSCTRPSSFLMSFFSYLIK